MSTVAFEGGYSLPGGDEPLAHARILHKGNRFLPMTFVAAHEATGNDGTAANDALTDEFWVPFDNNITQPLDFGHSDWAASNVTVASDGQTLTETTDTGVHNIRQNHTFVADEQILSFEIQRETVPEIQALAWDGTTAYSCYFDLRDGTVGTALNATGNIVDLGDGKFTCSIRFTPAAAAGYFDLRLANGSESNNYTGSTSNTIKVLRADANKSSGWCTITLPQAEAGDCFCIAGHNVGSRGGQFTFEHDSDENGSYTQIGSATPTDDGPVMFIHEGITSSRWRLVVRYCGGPRIAVIRVGKLLQMERPFYGGFSPVHMARKTRLAGTMSEGGRWLGRTVVSYGLNASYNWTNLTDTWVRANLDGKTGLIQSIEEEPFFIAWRSSEFNDCDYAWTLGPVQPPVYSGLTDRMTFGIQGEALGDV
jgi:hypothetical protein